MRASDLRLQAGKQLEGVDKERAARLYDLAAEIFDGADDKDVYAVTPLQKIFREQLIVGKHASAMRTLDRLVKIYRRLNQPHNIVKVLLSRVILLLAGADPVTAQREFERNLGEADFAASPEGAAAEDMIIAYSACARESSGCAGGVGNGTGLLLAICSGDECGSHAQSCGSQRHQLPRAAGRQASQGLPFRHAHWKPGKAGSGRWTRMHDIC